MCGWVMRVQAAERVLAWSVGWAARGARQDMRHNRLPFAELDRVEAAGTPLVSPAQAPNGILFAMMQLRCDWEQYYSYTGLGMPHHSSRNFLLYVQLCER